MNKVTFSTRNQYLYVYCLLKVVPVQIASLKITEKLFCH